ncbi:DUF1842 domain-containing protein [Undibacterium sp.]|uniref:DUF1842 domain-containing protein n=1 Tax=Undibacterium sp. TaxID=1914977 RepID=UPI00374CE2EF
MAAPENFHTTYLLESGSEFGSSLHLDLCVDTAHKKIVGKCCVKRGFVHFDLTLNGGYAHLVDNDSEAPLHIEIIGNPKSIPLRDTAFVLKMKLSPDWKTGKADYNLFSRQVDDALVMQDTMRVLA